MEARNQRPRFHEQIFTAIPRTQHHLASLPTPNQSTGPSRPVVTSSDINISPFVPIQAPKTTCGWISYSFDYQGDPGDEIGCPCFDLCLEGEMQAHLAAEMGASHMQWEESSSFDRLKAVK